MRRPALMVIFCRKPLEQRAVCSTNVNSDHYDLLRYTVIAETLFAPAAIPMSIHSFRPSELLCELIRIPSVNPMGGTDDKNICYENRVSDWLETFFDELNVPHERVSVASDRDNVIARYEAGSTKPTILLDAHQDTVSVQGMNAPFTPRIRDGRIYGRGACDVKGGMAAMLSAFARLVRESPQSANVILSCSCDEEATAMGVRQLVTYWSSHSTKSRLLSAQPDVCIVAEPTELHVVVAHRGVLRLRIHTQGQSCHASDPSQGKNAIYAMAPVVMELESQARQLSSHSQMDPLCGRPCMSVGIIQGGTAVNIVPANCTIEVDRRLIPGESPEQVWEQIRSSLSGLDAVRCESPWLAAPALSHECNSNLAAALQAALQSVGFANARQIGVAYCTNASTISSAGVPAVVFGPGSIAQAHTVEEFVDEEQLEIAAEAYYEFCASYTRPG